MYKICKPEEDTMTLKTVESMVELVKFLEFEYHNNTFF